MSNLKQIEFIRIFIVIFITIKPTKSGDYDLQATTTIIKQHFIKTEMENQLLRADHIQHKHHKRIVPYINSLAKCIAPTRSQKHYRKPHHKNNNFTTICTIQ